MRGIASFGLTLLCAAVIALPVAAQHSIVDVAATADRPAVMAMIAGGVDVNTAGPDGTTALMYAAYHGDVDLVRALIEAGADVHLRNEFGTTALTEAAVIGSAEIIQALLEAGADPETENPEGETPLMAVARTGNVEAARVLLDAGADVNAREEWGQQSAIMWAAAQGHPEMIRFLASRGADVDARGVIRQWERKTITEPRPKDMNKGGFTPLLYAAREGCVECARALIEAGADPDIADPERVTPLNMALLNLHFDFAAYMIQAGADVNKWDLFGRSPLYMAADVSTLPVKGNGAMAVIPSEDETTALQVGQMLLDAGADPNLRLKRRPPYRDVPQDRGGDGMLAQGATALLRAARAGDAPFVKLLIDGGAIVDLPSKEGTTPLMAAAGVDFGSRVTRGRNRTEEGVLETMRLLIEAGADINAQNVTEPRFREADSASQRARGFGRRSSQVPSPRAVPDQTPLHGAAGRGFTAFVRFLAENGADLTIQDANGNTALDLARGGVNLGGFGAPPPQPFPETASLLESLMREQGIEVPSPPLPAPAPE